MEIIKPKNLLLVRTDRIGDVVLSLPLAEIVKKYFPSCRITFLVRSYTSSIVKDHPFIDEIIILNEKNNRISLKKNVEKLSSKNFDSSVIVYPTFITSLIIFLSRIRNRIGTGYRWYSFLFNHKIFEHRKYAEKHELEYNVNLLRKFGIEEKVNFDNVKFHLKPDEKSRRFIEEIFVKEKINPDKPLIIFHPGSGGSSIDLPLNKFKELVELTSKKLDIQIIITGSESEKEICKQLGINDKIINLAGLLSLSQLIALIDKSDIFVSNSTGPIHLAAALGKYTIGFYPKLLACSARRWGPYTHKRFIFSPEIDCENCDREQGSNYNCMSSIKVTDIFDKIENTYKADLK